MDERKPRRHHESHRFAEPSRQTDWLLWGTVALFVVLFVGSIAGLYWLVMGGF